MRAFFSRLFGRRRERAARRRDFRRLVTEQLEVRSLMATTGIVVNDDQSWLNGGSIATFTYSGGTGGMFSTTEGGSFPNPFFPSPGMPPQPGRNGHWEFVGMGDADADGDLDIFAKDSGMAGTTPTKNGQWWVGICNPMNQFQFSLWDGAIPTMASIYGGTHQLTWGDHQVADFTGDGRADVLARVRETGKWYLWTTNSTGTGFTTEATGITTKSSLFGTWNITLAVDAVTEHHFQWRDALVGDFNDDGIADLAGRRITNEVGAGAIDEWYVGLGSATTTDRGETGIVPNTWWNVTSWQHDTTVVFNDTTWANAVVGDFNGDGQDDIAGRAAYPTEADGDREGEWWVSYTPDLVGDKVPALAWADWQHASLGNPHHWRDVQAGDFTGDGKDDILGRSQAGTLLLVDGNTGTTSTVGTWASPTSYPVFVAGDFTGDGLIDLAARNGMQWHLSIFTGTSFPTPTPKGGFRMVNSSQREDFFVKGSPQATVGSSLPLSLLQDLGRLSPSPNQFKDTQFILGRYNADGTLEHEGYGGAIPFNTVSLSYKLHLDFNGDDVQDILSQSITGQWYYSENYGNTFVTAMSDLSWVYEEYRNVLVGDFTGDGKDDLLSQKETVPNLASEWYLHASRGDGTFSTSLVHTRSYDEIGPHVWIIGGLVGDFNNDGKDDVTYLHKENDDPYDPTWVVEVVFSSGIAPTPAVPDPIQPGWAGVFHWAKDVSATEYGFVLWGVGDFDGDGADDVWGMQMTTIIVGPPQLTEQHDQLWVGFDGGGTFPAVYTFPEIAGMITIDQRGSKSGRFDSSADNRDDVVFEVDTGGSQTQLRVISSATWGADIIDTSGRVGGEQFTLVGDLDNDGSDDMIWIGTTPNHPIDLFVRVKVETIPSNLSGEHMFPYAVTNYIWSGSSRLRRRKPS